MKMEFEVVERYHLVIIDFIFQTPNEHYHYLTKEELIQHIKEYRQINKNLIFNTDYSGIVIEKCLYIEENKSLIKVIEKIDAKNIE